MDQSPTKALLDSMQTLMNAIVKPEYLKHEDEQVKLLAAVCTCEITRITAPDAPYDDDVLKVFSLLGYGVFIFWVLTGSFTCFRTSFICL